MDNVQSVVAAMTADIIQRSVTERSTYLRRIAAARSRSPARGRLACTNLVHGFAASDAVDKSALRSMTKPNIPVVSAYNDMLSAHQPFEHYPRQLKKPVNQDGV
jgi:phosphogluconate dehydratase